jgi:[methyl-Co(III) methanol-specific corrinoid protein]:coenzyme M methyltransferase
VVVSVCGDTNAVVDDLLACGAGALNVDQRNDLARTREMAGRRVLLLGNLDPVGVLSEGTPEAVADDVRRIALAGADAVWPGCDLWPEIPEENFRALMETARAYRSGAD